MTLHDSRPRLRRDGHRRGTAVLMASLRTMILSPASSWLVFIGLAIVTGTCMMKLPRIETRFSLSDALVFTSVLLFGPECAAIVAAVDALAASLRFNRRDRLFASRTMFNMTAAAVSIWVPAMRSSRRRRDRRQLDLSALLLPLWCWSAAIRCSTPARSRS